MGFSITQKTLERLEWPRIAARLAGGGPHPARPRQPRPGAGPGRRRPASRRAWRPCSSASRRRRRRSRSWRKETRRRWEGSARSRRSLARARKGGALRRRGAARAARDAGRAARDGRLLRGAPRGGAAARGARLRRVREQAALERRIEAALEPSGEVRDTASPELAQARRESRGATAEIQQRLERLLQDPDLRARLSDAYFTVRNDRYVLPVRAEAKGGVRGILHDASRSGTTVFVEPEALVELNNRLRQSGLAAAREALRVLEELSAAAGAAADEIEAGLRCAGLHRPRLRARARSRRSCARRGPRSAARAWCAPTGCATRCSRRRRPSATTSGSARATRCWCSPGPTPAGKTVALKSVALAALCVRAGLFVPAEPGARVDLLRRRARRHRRRAGHPREPLDLLRAHGEPRAHRRAGDSALAGGARRDRRPAPTRARAPRSRRPASRRSPTAGRA